MLKGRLFEFIICLVALGIAIIAMLQVPFTTSPDGDAPTTAIFTIFIAEGLAAALMLRHGVLKMIKKKKEISIFHRWLFIWLLPLAIFVVQLPWIFAGAFNDHDVNTIGAMAMLLFLPWIMIALGFLAMGIFWAPIEMTARGAYTAIKTKGKEGMGQLGMGLYFLLWVTIIIFGVLAASTDRVSYQAHNALLAALLGLPGDYSIKDETFLWVTRILLIIAIATPFIAGKFSDKNDPQAVVKRDSIKNKK